MKRRLVKKVVTIKGDVMVFKTIFRSDAGHPVSLPGKKLGMTFVRDVREDIEVRLRLDRIANYIPSYNQNIELNIDEENVVKSGRFDECSEIRVTVPAQSLNRFSLVKIVYERKESTGEVMLARPEWEIDKKKLIEAWAYAGYPLDWDPVPTGTHKAGEEGYWDGSND